MIPKEDYYKKLFLTGAIWNFAATLSFALGYKLMFHITGMAMPRYPSILMSFLALAFVFGIGYYWVYKDLHNNHAIVKLGIIGKILVFWFFFKAGRSGEISWLLAGSGFVDLIYAILYTEFLMTYKKQVTQTSQEPS